MKKLIFALALVLGIALIPQQASAQAQGGFQILSFDIGYAPSWNLNAGELVTPSLFGLNVRVADNLIVGFQTFTEDTDTDNYLTVKYDVIPQVRATVAFGTTAIFASGTGSESAVGFGFEAIPFTRNVGGSVTTEFKMAFQYLTPVEDITKGGLVFALAFSVGF